MTVECCRCFQTFAESETRYDPSVNHSVCNDKEACTLRMPVTEGGSASTLTASAPAATLPYPPAVPNPGALLLTFSLALSLAGRTHTLMSPPFQHLHGWRHAHQDEE